MHEQNIPLSTDSHRAQVNISSAPAWEQSLLDRWAAQASSDNPREAEIARRMQQRWQESRRPVAPRVTDGRCGPWAHVLHVITGAHHPTWNASQFKGGHPHAHASKSGTCLSVDESKGVWYCSSCRLGGTAVQWVMARDECSYLQAYRHLLETYGDPDA